MVIKSLPCYFLFFMENVEIFLVCRTCQHQIYTKPTFLECLNASQEFTISVSASKLSLCYPLGRVNTSKLKPYTIIIQPSVSRTLPSRVWDYFRTMLSSLIENNFHFYVVSGLTRIYHSIWPKKIDNHHRHRSYRVKGNSNLINTRAMN